MSTKLFSGMAMQCFISAMLGFFDIITITPFQQMVTGILLVAVIIVLSLKNKRSQREAKGE